jgi:peptidoglycan/LPS O-acetylase OafA/YrhL
MTSTTATDLLTRQLSPTCKQRGMPRLPILDGWRGISILLVLAAHLLPLGPKRFELNEAVAKMGMAIFFVLSGFLITSTLFFDPSVRNFAVRRSLRILPGAWLYLAVVLIAVRPAPAVWLANLLFTANSPPYRFVDGLTDQFWSLGVEVQFYLFIGLLFWMLGQRALALLPFVCIAVTLGRVCAGETTSIRTIYRVDEILTGASMAYLLHSGSSTHLRRALRGINPAIPVALLCLGSYHGLAPLQYLRPYFACIAVGTTLFHEGTWWSRFLESRPLVYLAAVSYALYVWHLMTTVGWFHQGSKVMIYAKRPLGLAITFLIAHLSTFYWERYWTGVGKRMIEARPA